VQLILIRHAEPVADVRGRCYGSLDVGLSSRGQEQCAGVAARLAAWRLTRVVSSPLERARATARPIAAAHGLQFEVVDDLRELDFGDIEGLTYEEIARTRPELYSRWMTSPTAVTFPGGESYADLSGRVDGALARLRSQAEPDAVIAAVTHGGVVRAVLAGILALPPERVFRVAVDHGSMTRIDWVADEPVVRFVNVAGES
jgi:alpha-ribazole phosphatase